MLHYSVLFDYFLKQWLWKKQTELLETQSGNFIHFGRIPLDLTNSDCRSFTSTACEYVYMHQIIQFLPFFKTRQYSCWAVDMANEKKYPTKIPIFMQVCVLRLTSTTSLSFVHSPSWKGQHCDICLQLFKSLFISKTFIMLESRCIPARNVAFSFVPAPLPLPCKLLA